MSETKKFLSWNVNGLRAVIKSGGLDLIRNGDYFAIAMQETKVDVKSVPEEMYHLGYHVYNNPAKRKGYSGTMTLSREKPIDVSYGFESEEGRILNLEFDNFYFINAYFPNSQHGLTRLDLKLDFDKKFLGYANDLRKKKPLIICGDFNVAHEEIDIARPKDNEHNAGFTIEERTWMSQFLSSGYVDTFRLFTTDGGHYSWWSYRFNAREKNIGWRIDYFVVSDDIKDKVKASRILENVKGSDHAPVELEIDI
ncbi:exodeoxyribonuclease [Thermoplasma volcanium GSS1]|uniref:Exodeoxyribonuclease n=1 Tax=Thermoplasma volcanium (strain ATCC 51530 / DSM 4299 / JCM 9571 / NBRC 15438 / GSS1) TaxID=273116 RepID=Q97CQ6_THEVO|nr:exodeoxyribonuclease III [Thermoplasma volcanium]BAB59187.1 exodeoxyribonuclease [Thermoplasma volcanium GSS1]